MKFKLLKMLLIVSSVAVINCGHVPVYDAEWCGDLGPAGAHCAHTLTPEVRDMNVTQWNSERVGMLCTKAQGFNDTETALDQLCQTTNLCDFETRENVKKALDRIRPVAKLAKAARKKHLAELQQGE